MKNVNTMWNNTRERDVKEPGLSITIPDMSINIADLLKTGTLEEVSEKLKKRMIYGTKIKIEDLTQLDYFKSKLDRYENLIRSNKQREAEAIAEKLQNETVETEQVIPQKSNEKAEASAN